MRKKFEPLPQEIKCVLKKQLDTFPKGPFVFSTMPFGVHKYEIVALQWEHIHDHTFMFTYQGCFRSLTCLTDPFLLSFTLQLQYSPSTCEITQESILVDSNVQQQIEEEGDLETVAYYEYLLVRAVWRHHKEFVQFFHLLSFLHAVNNSLFVFPHAIIMIIVNYCQICESPPCLRYAKPGILGIRAKELQEYQKKNPLLSCFRKEYALLPLP